VKLARDLRTTTVGVGQRPPVTTAARDLEPVGAVRNERLDAKSCAADVLEDSKAD